MRNLKKYKWRSNFHHYIWERIKEIEPSFPKWTFQELQEHGWFIRLKPKNARGSIELYHKDGTSLYFRMGINGQPMPHIMAMLANIYGYDHNNFRKPETDKLKAYLEGSGSGCLVTSGITGMRVTYPAGRPIAMFYGIQPTELDRTYKHPEVTTAEYFVAQVVGAANQMNAINWAYPA